MRAHLCVYTAVFVKKTLAHAALPSHPTEGELRGVVAVGDGGGGGGGGAGVGGGEVAARNTNK